jgi:hypothetical protein
MFNRLIDTTASCLAREREELHVVEKKAAIKV